jgi:hypothetical protein
MNRTASYRVHSHMLCASTTEKTNNERRGCDSVMVKTNKSFFESIQVLYQGGKTEK